MASSGSQIFIGIAGGSASGKTTLAKCLLDTLGPAQANLISLDWYYRDNSHLSLTERAALNYDHPAAFDFLKLSEDLQALHEGNCITAPEYDFALHCRSHIGHNLEPKRVTIVEGILVFYENALQNIFDLKIFVEAPTDLRLKRRISRDTQERGRSQESIVNQWNETVEPMYTLYCEPTAHCVQLTVPGTIPPQSCIDKILPFIDPL